MASAIPSLQDLERELSSALVDSLRNHGLTLEEQPEIPEPENWFHDLYFTSSAIRYNYRSISTQ